MRDACALSTRLVMRHVPALDAYIEEMDRQRLSATDVPGVESILTEMGGSLDGSESQAASGSGRPKGGSKVLVHIHAARAIPGEQKRSLE